MFGGVQSSMSVFVAPAVYAFSSRGVMEKLKTYIFGYKHFDASVIDPGSCGDEEESGTIHHRKLGRARIY
jgi:hypothetical protein